MPYPALDNAGIRLRRGQLSLTVAAPGVGKSQLWGNLVDRMQALSIYWSADTDQHDATIRQIARNASKTTTEVEAELGEPAWVSYYDELIASERVEWVFDPTIRGDGVLERVKAFANPHGEFPHLIVVDNLSNTVEHSSDAASEQADFMVQAQRLARLTRAHVSILAHAKGAYEEGDRPIPQGGVLNNLDKLPEIVLTLHRASQDGTLLGLNAVKNRGGMADPSAMRPIHFEVDYSRATVKGFRVAA